MVYVSRSQESLLGLIPYSWYFTNSSLLHLALDNREKSPISVVYLKEKYPRLIDQGQCDTYAMILITILAHTRMYVYVLPVCT